MLKLTSEEMSLVRVAIIGEIRDIKEILKFDDLSQGLKEFYERDLAGYELILEKINKEE